ncbi:hypothetical protein GCM10007881_61380 [Mesorhizobium huakuii]|uniref:hypothetical protein n=1 Tax=Mesorhizobium huakuii TaxID=28104 RepID=UPI00235BAC90|nr:hypothetical protein [Mesorhizobium huakuii]GLQ82615.1 hypothetical protein GCM10007881_61380 [Mesorhizobium huakuii]
MPADAKQDRLPAAGPWTKYQSTDIPPGFRVAQQPVANVFDQFDPPATVPTPPAAAGKDPWAGFPDAPAALPADKWSAFPDASPAAAPTMTRLKHRL